MNNNRKERLSNSKRFKIFELDNFTCQYCGGKSPDVILHGLERPHKENE